MKIKGCMLPEIEKNNMSECEAKRPVGCRRGVMTGNSYNGATGVNIRHENTGQHGGTKRQVKLVDNGR